MFRTVGTFIVRRTHAIWSLCALVSLLGAGPATEPATQPAPRQPNAFAIVLIDAKTEDRMGKFPYDRAILAQAIESAADMGARCVVLKFFLDLPRTTSGDDALAHAMARIPVILQAAAVNGQANPNPLPDRFLIPGISRDPRTIGGDVGWVPLPKLCASAADVGFANVRSVLAAPMIEGYGVHSVKSIWLCCLERAFDQSAQIHAGVSVTLAGKTLPLDSASEAVITFPAKDQLDYLSLTDFLSENVPVDRIQNRVVIIAYDGDKSPLFDTPLGKVGADRAFCYMLFSIYNKLSGG